jgi:hypothetical protein
MIYGQFQPEPARTSPSGKAHKRRMEKLLEKIY